MLGTVGSVTGMASSLKKYRTVNPQRFFFDGFLEWTELRKNRLFHQILTAVTVVVINDITVHFTHCFYHIIALYHIQS